MNSWKLTIILLFLIFSEVILAVFAAEENETLQIIACDVGQGDAILINHKNTQILVDGGPGNKAVDCLSRHMPFFDKKN